MQLQFFFTTGKGIVIGRLNFFGSLTVFSFVQDGEPLPLVVVHNVIHDAIDGGVVGVEVDVEAAWVVRLELGRVVDDWHLEHVPERLDCSSRILPRRG